MPLDGLWRMGSGNTGSIFRIDKGRMYFYERRKTLPKNTLLPPGTIKDPKYRSAADWGRQPGDVIAKDIKQTDDPLTYNCQSLSYDAQRHIVGFGGGEIKIASGIQLILKTLPNPETALGGSVEESFLRENLDNQTLFEQSLIKRDDRTVQAGKEIQPQPVLAPIEPPPPSAGAPDNQSGDTASQNRKVIAVPPDKMESKGKLAKPAKEFIEQTLQNAKESNGYVEINCPSTAPESVVHSLTNIGVETFVDENRNDYELVIIKP